MTELRDWLALVEQQQVGPVIRVYHGTRHHFPKFLMRAVGTGEGAQVFGYGLYFAENFEVAKYYADKLGEPLQPGEPHAGIVYEVAITADPASFVDYDAKLNQQSQFVQDALGDHLYRDEPLLDGVRFAESLPQDIAPLIRIMAMRLVQEHGGDLAAVAAAFEQRTAHATPKARADVERVMAQLRSTPIRTGRVLKPGAGSHWLQDWRELHQTPKAASAALRKLGIKGIRYLDEGSREVVGHATHNYVVFSARSVKIVRAIAVAETGA